MSNRHILLVPLLLLLTFLIVTSVGPAAVAQPVAPINDGLSDRYLVGIESLDRSAEIATVLRDIGLTVAKRYRHVHLIAVEGPPRLTALADQIPGVTFVERDEMVVPVPDDAEMDNAWHAKRAEAMVVHQAGYKGSGIKVANIDFGIDYANTELQHATATRSWQNFTDDGGGSKITTACPASQGQQDAEKHGNRTSGVIIAADNSTGMVGVAPDVDFWMLRTVRYSPQYQACITYASWNVDAIEWAIDNNIDVLNYEVPLSNDYSSFHQAVKDAVNAGIIFTVPAGNTEATEYPAGYSEPIVVAASTEADRNVPGWYHGSTVDLAAPGVNIYTTEFPTGYVTVGGSSVSAPIVAGVAALHLDQGVSASQIEQKIKDEAYDLLKDGWDEYTGYGLVLADTNRKQFPRGLSSSITVVGALDDTETKSVDVKFYADGSQIKQKTLTLNGLKPTSIYLPNEFSSTDPGEVVAKLYASSSNRKFNAQITSSNSGPTNGMGFRAVELFTGSLYAPSVGNGGDRNNSGYVSRIRLIADPDADSDPSITVVFRDSGGTQVYSYNTTVPRKAVYTVPTARIPWNNTLNELSVEVQHSYGTWVGGVVETMTTDGKRISDYPLIGHIGAESYGHRFLHAYQNWLSYAYILNTVSSSATYTMTYHAGTTGDDTQYTGTIPAKGFVRIPDDPYPGYGNEGAIQVQANRGIVLMVRTINYNINAQGDYQGDLEWPLLFPDKAYVALNVYNYYGWYCASPVQNVNATNNVTLTQKFVWSGGSWSPTALVDAYHADPFMNTGIPQNTLASAKSWGSPSTHPWSGSQCYHNGVGTDRVWYAAEGTLISDSSRNGPHTRYAGIAYTGKWTD